ncbi:hypothetical protein Raf01_42320 [Rugosimonospora africana]|uniref:Uncharacterized protein n=1 Tax=Rugosimonospora africana TaxID=556532 RepID=A0A8J3VRD2_9ACTN|nr:hypothetical protein Raf01_42320 [Rugosimonospora africana]
MPLLEAWTDAGPDRAALLTAERDLLTMVELSVRRGSDLLVRLPGGLHRLPLLAAVMIAADTLSVAEAELNRVVGAKAPPGPVALVTPRLIRRSELDQLDAASVPVAPALHPHRLRGDGLASPVRGGRPRLVTGSGRLLFVSPTTGFPPVLGVPPRVVVIDSAADVEPAWLSDARKWAAEHASVVITFTELHEELKTLRVADPKDEQDSNATSVATTTPQQTDGENCWIADWPWLRRNEEPLPMTPTPASDVEHGGVMEIRATAHLIAVDDPGLAGIADVRERLARLRDPGGRPPPWPVCRAARLTRLLAELPTRTGDYDRIAPRYGGRTLRRLLDDVMDADPRNDFPDWWRVRVAADWGAVRAGLTAMHDARTEGNPLADVVADLAEDAYRRGQPLDIICGSRTARDALTGRLLSNGALRIEDTPLVTIRSVSSIESAGAHQNTLLVGPPAARWRNRLTAADLGQLTVVAAPGDRPLVHRALLRAYSEPSREIARRTRCATLTALTDARADEDELDGNNIPVAVTMQATERGQKMQFKLPAMSALLTAAMSEPSSVDLDVTDLEGEPSGSQDPLGVDAPPHGRAVLVVPVVAQSTAPLDEHGAPTMVFLLPKGGRVQRLRDDEVRLLPVADITAGVTLIGISEPERRTLFDRVRPYLVEQRPQVARLLLQLWRIALDDACIVSGSVTELTGRLADMGADVSYAAVRQWNSSTRIGPEDPANVARVGRVAGNAVVVGEAGRIAAVMRAARAHHAAVGNALGKLAAWHASGDTTALERSVDALGADITDLAADLTAWRVIAVGDPAFAPASVLRRPMTPSEATRVVQPASDASAGSGAQRDVDNDEINTPVDQLDLLDAAETP